jgi:hypothetical protein
MTWGAKLKRIFVMSATKFIVELSRALDATIFAIVPSQRTSSKQMRLRVSFDNLIYFEGEHLMTTFPEGKKATISLKVQTSKGKPAKLDGVPVWENSNPLAADLSVAADGLSGALSYLDEGTGQVKVTGDADLGEGVKHLIGLLDYTCLPGEATVILLEAGPLEDVVV